ncbi:unnamed protein product [Cyprideis torosa]|uniref:Uncharacterized protein n=1 Tax=Cyprideis torosa TaxID=163714 RepID=A0A7R8WNU3_9CRUS|nr:unnamed protein product [Cyprideis torosa]CAG0906531.1 unnamed protein product [Cyprideis torosa]
MHPERACGMGVRNVARYERRTPFGEGSSSRKPGPTKATDESKVHSGALEPTGRKRSFWRRLFPGRNRSRRNHSPIEEN